MILADKIINLRKKNGWSQKLNVSRQAVSKWEGAQSTPDLEKILMMSKIFGVTTDFLVKDEIEMEDIAPLMYIKYRIHGVKTKFALKHIVIDGKTSNLTVEDIYEEQKKIK